MNTSAARDLYAETTARIGAALEQGVAPWVKPWSTGIDTLPMNGGTRRPYRGVNVLLLELEAWSQRNGFCITQRTPWGKFGTCQTSMRTARRQRRSTA